MFRQFLVNGGKFHEHKGENEAFCRLLLKMKISEVMQFGQGRFCFSVQWFISWCLIVMRLKKKKNSGASGRGLLQEDIKERISAFGPAHLLELQSP